MGIRKLGEIKLLSYPIEVFLKYYNVRGQLIEKSSQEEVDCSFLRSLSDYRQLEEQRTPVSIRHWRCKYEFP